MSNVLDSSARPTYLFVLVLQESNGGGVVAVVRVKLRRGGLYRIFTEEPRKEELVELGDGTGFLGGMIIANGRLEQLERAAFVIWGPGHGSKGRE